MKCKREKSQRIKGAGDYLVFMVILGGFVALLTTMTSSFSKSFNKKNQMMASNYLISSGAETVLTAFRLAYIQYISELSKSGCSEGRPFLEALKNGSNCSVPINVFTSDDLQSLSSGAFFSYINPNQGGGCSIVTNSSSCGNGDHPLIQAPFPGESQIPSHDASSTLLSVGYLFTLNSINLERGIVDISVDYLPPGSVGGELPEHFRIGLRPVFGNAAHLEQDGRVVQESVDPFTVCQGAEWANLLLFNPTNSKCEQFAQMGSGSGLAFYNGRYFGLRSFDGQIIDLTASTQDSSSSSYLVDENGEVSGKSVLFSYSRSALINIDDITIIPTFRGTSNNFTFSGQLYYVTGQGATAELGGISKEGRQPICSLGSLDWGQAYNGILAASFSDPLIPEAGDGLEGNRLALFYLKTVIGDILTAAVIRDAKSGNYFCHVAKEKYLQKDEYKRTLGFDRTDRNEPYVIY
jgi:hypothetical protein